MPSNARHVLLLLLLALGVNNFALGQMWIRAYENQTPVEVAFALYAVSLLLSLYSTNHLKLPRVVAYANLAVSLVVPLLVIGQLQHAKYSASGSYETWFIAGISLILAITSARGYPVLGWIGIVYLWVVVIIWGGFGAITTTGLIGALLLVMTAVALGRGLSSTMHAAADYYRQAAALQTRTARNSAAREARSRILQTVMLTGQPLLERIRDQKGDLSDLDRQEAALLEARFRDEIQGRGILSDGIRLAAREARKRGVEVSFNDEGGLNGASESELAAIRDSVIQALNATNSGKIHISAPAGQNFRVAVTAQRPEASGPDLWLRLS